MASKKIEVDGVRIEVWEQSYRINDGGLVGPVHWVNDSLEDSLKKTIDLMKRAREYQWRADVSYLQTLEKPVY
jgi:hypothetical protein